MNVPAIRVLVVDDHAMVRQGLRMLIERGDEIVVVGEASTKQQALDLATAHRPDVVLLDLDLGTSNALDFLPDLRALAPEMRVVVLTGVRDPASHQSAIRMGALGIVMKEEAAQTLVSAITAVASGQAWIDPSLVASIITDFSRPAPPPTEEDRMIATLTPRERDVVELVGEGLRNREIAHRLAISDATVNHHLTSIFRKLDVPGRLELVIFAYRHGLAHLPT